MTATNADERLEARITRDQKRLFKEAASSRRHFRFGGADVQAGFVRRNIVQLDVTQPIYTAGRLSHAYGAQAAGLDAARLQLERARQDLQFQVVEAFYAALDAARLELESAWTAFEAADEVVSTQEKALELARESMAIAQVSYENGVITAAELNDTQVRLLQTDWLLTQARSTGLSQQPARGWRRDVIEH